MIYSDRNEDYGDYCDQSERVAMALNALLYHKVMKQGGFQSDDFAIIMTAVKLVRETQLSQLDNISDAIGYLALQRDLITKKEKRAHGGKVHAD